MKKTEKVPEKKLLIVEDNQDSRELVIKILRNLDYQLIEAVDGEDGLKKAIAKQPDIILLDISLPKMGGYEVVKNLRLREEFKHTSIIALTAHAMKGDEEKALQAGFNGYISKPIDVHELPKQIEYYAKKLYDLG
ncbi:MAG: two-component system response regulator [delta proteobacterium ML8_D]|jgi:two-component system, cell cycle response regulator DivK|nr:MAG: two-component system response regulator [delta proteobacterium ML8_D]